MENLAGCQQHLESQFGKYLYFIYHHPPYKRIWVLGNSPQVVHRNPTMYKRTASNTQCNATEINNNCVIHSQFPKVKCSSLKPGYIQQCNVYLRDLYLWDLTVKSGQFLVLQIVVITLTKRHQNSGTSIIKLLANLFFEIVFFKETP